MGDLKSSPLVGEYTQRYVIYQLRENSYTRRLDSNFEKSELNIIVAHIFVKRAHIIADFTLHVLEKEVYLTNIV